MRVGVVGAGPAGLYLATLLKRDDPARDVTVVERNPPGATYGWGVVFSEDTLVELRDADYETFLALDRRIVRWSAIDIHYRGTIVRARGQGFSAIRRTALLAALQKRAREVGVELRFEVEAAGPEIFDDRDLVVGADGVSSAVREARRGVFRPSISEHETRYAWFGTDHVFDVFTFAFVETADGLFTAHAYPFDSDASTFIVECREETWRRAGLHEATEEESLAYCEELFADVLSGRRLASNRSVWTTFSTVRNAAWQTDRIVLVGDAAHTAHFSIGSGTKLAIEDAVALARALAGHEDDLHGALLRYEGERRPPVERFQDAAIESARYFATVARYLDLAPEQFAYNLLTRSGRIRHGDLTARDPALVLAATRRIHALAEGSEGRGGRRIVEHPPFLAPLHLGSLRLENRVVLALAPADRAVDGRPGAAEAGQLAGAVDSGAGLVVTEPLAVSAHGRITRNGPGLYEPEHAAAWSEVLERGRGATGTRVAARLTHAGRRGATRARGGGLDRPLAQGAWPLLAPSPLPYLPSSQVPRDLFERAGDVRDDFAQAARLAAEAGFDVLVLDLADGYLLASCLSPLTNRRQDDHGGTLERRLGYPLEVLDAVRASWPEERPLVARLNADDRRPGGLTPDDAVEVARHLARAGVDLVDVAAGHTVPTGLAASDYRRGFLVELSTKVRNEAGIATLVGGRITTLDEVDTIVAAGRADLVRLDPGAYRREVVQQGGESV